MAQGVGEREIAAKLRYEAKAEERGQGTAGRYFQRNTERDVDDEKKYRAGNHSEAQKDKRAGGHAHAFGREHVHREARGRCQGHGVAPAEIEVPGEVARNDDHASSDSEK